MLLPYAVAACLDFAAAIHDLDQLDYAEGIVWQQTVLIPGPHAYRTVAGLPFVVFNYPPVYSLAVRAVAAFGLDMLAAGRMVSALAALLVVPLVAGLVWTATPGAPSRQDAWSRWLVAILAGLLALCLHAVRTWGLFMRVDMLAVALGLAAVLVAARADGRLWGSVLALLLAVAAVYTKQTELPAGGAILAVTLWRRPRVGLLAGGMAVAVALSILLALQGVTEGGFLRNIVGYNINSLGVMNLVAAVQREDSSGPLVLLMLVGAAATVLGLHADLRHGAAWDRARTAQALVVAHFALAVPLAVFTLLKSGSNNNYLLDPLTIGCALVGILLHQALARPVRVGLIALVIASTVLAAPLRLMPEAPDPAALAVHAELVRRIAAADQPVASEDMSLLMQAGKPVLFEPAMVTELAALGMWDEAPLLEMIRRRGFAFMITGPDNPVSPRRSPAVDAAMRAAYPVVEAVGPRLRLHLPPDQRP